MGAVSLEKQDNSSVALHKLQQKAIIIVIHFIVAKQLSREGGRQGRADGAGAALTEDAVEPQKVAKAALDHRVARGPVGLRRGCAQRVAHEGTAEAAFLYELQVKHLGCQACVDWGGR